jgi:hypothetical protein
MTHIDSLYAVNAIMVADSDPRPAPGTVETHAVETIDNDRAFIGLDVGVIR